nr:hypothetical protein [uncultured Methanospirillum sp.]
MNTGLILIIFAGVGILCIGVLAGVSALSSDSPGKQFSRDGYTLMIPSSWMVQEEKDSVIIELPDGSGSVNIGIASAQGNLSQIHGQYLNYIIQTSITQFDLTQYTLDSESVGTIDDKPALSTIFTLNNAAGAGVRAELFTIEGTNQVFHILFTEPVERYDDAFSDFEEILRTITIR